MLNMVEQAGSLARTKLLRNRTATLYFFGSFLHEYSTFPEICLLLFTTMANCMRNTEMSLCLSAQHFYAAAELCLVETAAP